MRQYNKNWLALRNSYISGKRGVVLEGGSRSQKTWSCIDFLIYLFARKVKKVTVNIVKETFASFKTTLYDDFNRRLPDYNIQSVFQEAKEIRTFWIFGNKINLIGTDKVSKFEGLGSDFVWLNEPIPISQYFFDQLEMRCRYFWFMDFNPSVTQHWIFDRLEKREDVVFCHSTFYQR